MNPQRVFSLIGLAFIVVPSTAADPAAVTSAAMRVSTFRTRLSWAIVYWLRVVRFAVARGGHPLSDWRATISYQTGETAPHRIRRLCVVIVIMLIAIPNSAWCDPIRITQGNVFADEEEPFEALRISGDGLQFVSSDSPLGGHPKPAINRHLKTGN